MPNQTHYIMSNWKFGLGLLAGAAAGYWLNTTEGKRFRQQTQNQLNEYGEQAGQYLAETAERAENSLNEYTEKGKTLLEDGKQRAQTQGENLKQSLISGAETAADKAEQAVDNISNSLKKGIQKAKGNLPSDSGKIA